MLITYSDSTKYISKFKNEFKDEYDCIINAISEMQCMSKTQLKQNDTVKCVLSIYDQCSGFQFFDKEYRLRDFDVIGFLSTMVYDIFALVKIFKYNKRSFNSKKIHMMYSRIQEIFPNVYSKIMENMKLAFKERQNKDHNVFYPDRYDECINILMNNYIIDFGLVYVENHDYSLDMLLGELDISTRIYCDVMICNKETLKISSIRIVYPYYYDYFVIAPMIYENESKGVNNLISIVNQNTIFKRSMSAYITSHGLNTLCDILKISNGKDIFTKTNINHHRTWIKNHFGKMIYDQKSLKDFPKFVEEFISHSKVVEELDPSKDDYIKRLKTDPIENLITTHPIKFNRYEGNKSTKTFDYINIELSCIGKSEAKELFKDFTIIFKQRKKEFDKYVVNLLKNSKRFQNYGVPINFLKIDRIQLLRSIDIVYTISLKIESKGEENEVE